ncbi:MAG TPA: holo-ACP synthase [Burkholderiales bacterium]|nr:holo-ACP synthase [Burkholderiales bacterium]
MIYGVGTDLVEPGRVAMLLEKYGERFPRRVLSAAEWPAYKATARPVLFLAGRFAAKEAFSKALGTGLRHPATLRAISVLQDRLGKPFLAFAPALERLLREQGIVGHHLTLSHERSLACAFVVLER